MVYMSLMLIILTSWHAHARYSLQWYNTILIITVTDSMMNTEVLLLFITSVPYIIIIIYGIIYYSNSNIHDDTHAQYRL